LYTECRRGVCQQAICGNGIVASSEQCDVAATECINCRLAPGYSCNGSGCAQNAYRVALADDQSGWVDIVSLSATGITTIDKTYQQGYNAQSPWAEWSIDGTKLAYTGVPGTGPASVYLFDVTSSSTNYIDYTAGQQPSIAADHLNTVVAALDAGYTTFAAGASPVASAISSFQVQWPKWNQTDATSFAFLDRSSASTSGGLYIYAPQKSTTTAVETAGVMAYDWTPNKPELYYLISAPSDCELRVASSSGLGITPIVTGVPCQATVVASPDGTRFAASAGSTMIFMLRRAAAAYPWVSVSAHFTAPATVLDLAWTPDGKYLGVLSGTSSNASSFSLIDANAGTTVSVDVQGAYKRLRFDPVTL